jgi:hypothetical protein
LTNLYWWVFADKWSPTRRGHAHAMVNITSDRGLNKKYFDMSPELGGINTTDQYRGNLYLVSDRFAKRARFSDLVSNLSPRGSGCYWLLG